MTPESLGEEGGYAQSEVVLVGGGSRVPSTKVQILTCFTSTKVQILTCLGEKGGQVPSEVVLVGGASRVPKILSNLHKTVAALGQSVQVLLYQ